MARETSVAATAESTPPERAQITSALPTSRRMRSIASSTNELISHDGAIAATWCKKFWMIAVPASVWTTSGWNVTPKMRRSASPMAATAERSVCAYTRNPGGGAVTVSPCDIETRERAGTPSRIGAPGTSTVSMAGPNSLWASGTSVPPSFFASNCMP